MTGAMNEPPVEIGADEVRAQSRRIGRPHVDLVIALTAIAMSAISLAVAFENERTERGLLAASSWPFLREIVTNQYDGGRSAAIGVSNGGVGPAKLKTLEITYAGHSVSSALDLLRRCCGLGAKVDVARQLPHGIVTSVADETVLRPGEENIVLAVPRSADAPEVPTRFVASLLEIGFRACYCSVLDECWTSDLRSTRTTAIDRCPAPAVPFDPNGR